MKNRFIAVALTLCLSFACASVHAASEAQAAKTEHWHGEYQYPESKTPRKPVSFTVTLIKVGKSIRGKITEPNTFGDNGFDKLFANIKGSFSANGDVKFTKTYDGTAGVSHSVKYAGKLSDDKKTITGTWQVKQASGHFFMTKTELENDKSTSAK